MSEKSYLVRLGDDGRAAHNTDSLQDAVEWAKDYSLENWAGKAQVLARIAPFGKIVLVRDGEIEWVHREVTL